MDTALNREALLEAEKAHWRASTPMGRLGRPDELNGLAVFLASEASAFVTGAEMLVDVSFFCCCSFSSFVLCFCFSFRAARVMAGVEYLN